MDKYEKLERYLGKIAPDIGHLVIVFNSLEDTLDSIIIETLNEHNDVIGYAVISGMSFSSKIDLLSRMVSYELHGLDLEKKKSKVDQFDILLQKLREANVTRNDIIHSAWLEYDLASGNVRTKMKVTPEGLEPRNKKIEHKDIRKAIKSIEKLEEKLYSSFENSASWWA
jgi:hypothetical protein